MSEFTTIYIHTYQTRDGHKPSLRERLEMRKTCGPYQWTPTTPGKGRGFYSSSRNQLEMGDATFRLRLELANDHLRGRLARTNGYYCDLDGDTTLTPVIARLPHGRGFLAGWTMGAGTCGALDAYVYSDVRDAAGAAHQMAENDAEAQREYEDAENARLNAEEVDA